MTQPPIERGFFRKAEDGTMVFFPWGLAHRGFRLGDDEGARRRASRAVSLVFAAVLGVGTWAAYVLQPLVESEATGLAETLAALVAPGAALLLVLAVYGLWVARFVERLPESDLAVSRDERLREAAAHVEPRAVALLGVTFCGLSAFLVWLRPDLWWLGLLGLAFGIGTVVWSRLMRRAAASYDAGSSSSRKP